MARLGQHYDGKFSAGNSASREPRKHFLNICNGAFHCNQSCVLLAKLARTQRETEKKVKKKKHI